MPTGQNRKREPLSTDIFISYASADAPFVEALVTRLRVKGVTLWLDHYEIRPGDYLRDRINEGIANASYFVAVLSPTSVRSDWVRHEIDAAMTRELAHKGVRVIPLLVGNVTMNDLPPDIRGKNFLDFRSESLQEVEIARLINLLRPEESVRKESFEELRATPPMPKIGQNRTANRSLLKTVVITAMLGVVLLVCVGVWWRSADRTLGSRKAEKSSVGSRHVSAQQTRRPETQTPPTTGPVSKRASAQTTRTNGSTASPQAHRERLQELDTTKTRVREQVTPSQGPTISVQPLANCSSPLAAHLMANTRPEDRFAPFFSVHHRNAFGNWEAEPVKLSLTHLQQKQLLSLDNFLDFATSGMRGPKWPQPCSETDHQAAVEAFEQFRAHAQQYVSEGKLMP